MPRSANRFRPILIGAFICALVIIGALIAVRLIGGATDTIEYHRRAMTTARERFFDSRDDREAVRHDRRFERHRARLVELGYLQHRVFPLRAMDLGSTEIRDLSRAARELMGSESSCRFVWRADGKVTDGLKVWAPAHAMPEWATFLAEFAP